MSIEVQCTCGKPYRLKDELAGKTVKCPACQGAIQVSAAAAASLASPVAAAQVPPTPPPLRVSTPAAPVLAPPLPPSLSASPYRSPLADITPARPDSPAALGNPLLPFARDKFLLRQKHLSINQKYEIWNEQGNSILFVERPTHFFRSLGAVFGALAAGLLVGAVTVIPGAMIAEKVSEPAGIALVIVGIFLGIVAALTLGVVLSPKRHVHFYHDASKSQQVLQIMQDKKFTPINATYTVLDSTGNIIAKLHKNYLYNFFRKRWYVYGVDGSVQFMAMEDSIVLSLLRRVCGPMYGLLRTNFIIVRGENSEDEIGQFNRKFTLLDRYVLDLSDDPQRSFDRRVALALGLMLDTGERR